MMQSGGSVKYSKNFLNKNFTKSELLDLFCMLDRSRYIQDEDELKKLILEFRKLTSFEFSICAVATQDREVIYSLDVDSPDDYLKHYIEKKYSLIDPVVTAFIQNDFHAVNWLEVETIYSRHPENFVNIDAESFGLKDGFTSGSAQENYLASFWWGNEIERNDRAKTIFDLAGKYLTGAMIDIYEKNRLPKREPLSPKEVVVLNWLKEGKCSRDIAIILQISERTVNFHVNNIMGKLDAINRTQAVAIALEERLIT